LALRANTETHICVHSAKSCCFLTTSV